MPIIDVEIILRPRETVGKEIVSELANELGDIFHTQEGQTWVKVRELSADHYAENGEKWEGVYPIFISVIKSKLPADEEMQEEAQKITGAVAQICGRSSENVHVMYQPEGRGRVAFGGKIVS
jgi:phenylpyruvate tautomerase PptA (4-oxalocrotonate tautomerase family)